MKTHLSLAGWQATLARLAGLLRPRVETVHVVNQRNELQIEGFATCARVGLGGSRDGGHDYLVAEVRLGGGGPPPSLNACDLWGRDVIEVGRLGSLCAHVLRDVRVYTREVPCRVCGGSGLSTRQEPCGLCRGSKLEPNPDGVPWCALPGWEVKP